MRPFYHHKSIISQQAFTLIEMLVVLVIIGLTSSIVMMNTTRTITPQTPAIIQFFEQERAATLLNSQATKIQLLNDRLYSTTSKNSFSLPQNNPVIRQRYLPNLTLTTFYPDGTMSASNFTLQTETYNYEIETSPFSNKIQYTQQANR